MGYRPFTCEMEICIPGSLGIRQVADCILVLHKQIFTRRCAARCWKARLLDGQPFPSALTDDVPAPAAPFDHRIVMAKHAAVESLYAVSKSEILGGWVRPSLNNASVKADKSPQGRAQDSGNVASLDLRTANTKSKQFLTIFESCHLSWTVGVVAILPI